MATDAPDLHGRGPWPAEFRRTVAGRVAWVEQLADAGATVPELVAFARFVVTQPAGAPPRPRAGLLLVAVHAVTRYVPDPCADCYQGARWTYRHGAGDCHALVALYVALCRAAGVVARPVWLPQKGASFDHVYALARDDAGREQMAEPSIPGAALGEHPYDAAARLSRGREVLAL